jgi:hypothetical protein
MTAPVQIAIGPDGRLVISSQDTAALDLLEELLSQLAPARKDFQDLSAEVRLGLLGQTELAGLLQGAAGGERTGGGTTTTSIMPRPTRRRRAIGCPSAGR